MDTPNGLVADRYRLVRLVGRGGMGAVWEGWDERLRRPVALKMLHTQHRLPAAEAEELAERAMREARVVARLQHRHAVAIYDVTEYEGQPCLVMEFVPSQTLAEVLGELGTLHEHEAATLGGQVASALAVAHAAGVVHRDVKPANILVADDGAARISDFGIAHAFGEATLTSAGMLTGTPAYLAPEVARGEGSSPASDVFSLGATLYAALEGQPPFGEQPNAIGMLHRVAGGQVEPPQHARALAPLLMRMLATDPRERPTMAEVADELQRFPTADLPALEHPVDAPTDRPAAAAVAAPTRRRRRALLALVALFVVAALVVAGLVLLRPAPGTDPTTPPAAEGGATATATRSEATGTVTSSVTSEPTSEPTTASPTAVAPPPAPAATSAAPPPVVPPPAPAGGTTVPVSGTPTPAQLAGAVSNYYSLVPGQLDQAWPLMTADYQTRVAGGRQAYQRFWDGFSKVTATEVVGSSPSTVTALITYTTKSGSVIRERTTFRMVPDGGVLKIAASTVTSRS
ncbi:MAG TPA: serine/threonine-protein kinase [Lapillicoccus sp.]|nr:serine/threonine-protein kinase [Lapillicoccus sp.]